MKHPFLYLIRSDDFYITFFNNTPDYIVTSGLFSIVPGGPTPQVSVTVIEGQISTIGGGVFTAPNGVTTPTFPTAILPPAPTSTVASTPPAEPITKHNDNHNISKTATIGIGVAVALVVVILIVAVGYYLWTKRRGRPQKLKETDSLPLRKYPGLKNLEPRENEVADGPRVDVWGT